MVFNDLVTTFLLCFYQNAVSMYCRLGFAVKKGQVFSSDQLHPTWKNAPSVNRLKYVAPTIKHPSSHCNGGWATSYIWIEL